MDDQTIRAEAEKITDKLARMVIPIEHLVPEIVALCQRVREADAVKCDEVAADYQRQEHNWPKPVEALRKAAAAIRSQGDK